MSNKKIYISIDIEGINGATTRTQCDINSTLYPSMAEKMNIELQTAVGIINKINPDASIVIKDAHDTGLNIDNSNLPNNCTLIRGWAREPLKMLQGIDETFDCSLLIGYHSAAGSGASPLSHTFNHDKFFKITLNGKVGSEFLFSYYTSLYYGVPVILITGDENICKEAKSYDSNIQTVVTQKGVGGSMIVKAFKSVLHEYEREVEQAFNIESFNLTLPESFEINITYKEHQDAYRASFYPGCSLLDDSTITFYTNVFYEILRMLNFV